MLHFTIYKHDIWNANVFDFASGLIESKNNYSTDELRDLLQEYYNRVNITADYNPFEIQEVNDCFLIYRGLDHLLTIKTEL